MLKMKWYYYPIMIICLLGIVACLGFNIYSMTLPEYPALLYVSVVLLVFGLIAAIFYIFKGYKKAAAGYHKIFLYNCVLSDAISVLYIMLLKENNQLIGIICNVLSLMLLLILAIGENLGKAKSYLLALLILAINAFMLVGTIAKIPGVAGTAAVNGTFFICLSASQLSLAMIMCLFTFVKYADKAARGSK